eukprot:CAMPEP_0194100522 /NCGR_PEP_ID=MMETSP0150-20130528/1329_1 /TAXON_ID=122233 /ORGANISM="Chaetoceros debilis, Strain MM31A-1" /LENGTH=192 /DNA_ID=CAMNT_0038786887 /DNA_START=1516 /DNA_END=2091 /DNA_ORIENTATION=+
MSSRDFLDRPTDHHDDAPLAIDMEAIENSETSDCNYYNKEGNIASGCTYLNIKENMEDGKSPTFMKFASNIATAHGLDYVVKLDDDTYLSTVLFTICTDEELPPAPYNIRTYVGPPHLSRLKNHVYAAGEMYIVSTDLASYVANKLSFEDRENLAIHIEDLDMGTYVHSSPRPVKYKNINGGMFYHHPCKSE